MDLTQLAEKIDKRFDELRDKLDMERAARNEQLIETVTQIGQLDGRIKIVETRQAGYIKLVWVLITATIGGIITYITNIFK